MGEAPYRIDLREKVTGAARFIDDLPDLLGTAYAAALRSPYSHARIVSIDSSRAEQLPRVLAILHRDTLSEYGVYLENGDGPGPFGSKGIAQTAIPCVFPALCNAIYDATGVRLNRIPFTPEAILRELGELHGA